MQIEKKLAIVTGAGRGIGKAIAIELGRSGIIVAGVDYSESSANDITTYLKEQNLQGKGFVMDVTQQDSIDNALKEIAEVYGAANIVVNNAGITRDNLMLRMSQEEWDQVINTNLTAAFRLCRSSIRDMVKARWGRIVNITSVVAFTGNGGQANYCASKAGLVALTKSLAIEVASRNITVNAVAPGFVESAMTNKLTPEQREAILCGVPMKRVGQPEDIAKVVAFLISDAASYITGETLHVNGGMFMA
ncbi:MAG: 3-oxoacyl-ACP reductase FabG [Gammaproteobacteria bacterium]|nr:3-oxoacyl-ACP reductase FabG [Gammaproteobacteria bacterium]